MLQTILIRDFAIISSLELDFQSGLSILTGETGTGKSILLDALGLLLGKKAEASKVKLGAEQALLQALFDISHLHDLKVYFKEQGIVCEDDELLIRRIISRNGKGKIYVGDNIVTLNQLKEIGQFLVNIYAQHTHQTLLSESIQRVWLDGYAGHRELLNEVMRIYQAWQKCLSDYQKALIAQEQLQSEYELLTWKNQELTALNPQPGEWEELSLQYDKMSHHRELIEIAHTIEDSINSDKGLAEKVSFALSQVSRMSAIEKHFQDSEVIFSSIEAELSEITAHMRAIISYDEEDEEIFEQINNRLSQLNAVAKKYAVRVEDLPDKYREIQQKLQTIEVKKDLQAQEEALRKWESTYQQAALALSQSRQQAAEGLSREVNEIIHKLAMPHAIFAVQLQANPPSAHGNETVQFLVAINPGSNLQPLNKVSSGGELSRISLALQVSISAFNHPPTLVFDEVDSGIGGKTATEVGLYLKKLSTMHQILLVTHLPQVAVYAKQHYEVSKKVVDGKTISTVKPLNEADRKNEIARMLGGGHITPLSREHASELIDLAQQ